MKMSLVIWMATMTISLSAIILSAAAGMPDVNAWMAGVVSVFIAAVAIAENRTMAGSSASEAAIASSTARHMGMVWAWGALGLFTIYYFILQWKEWLPFTMAFIIVAVICLFFASILKRDSQSDQDDGAMTRIARTLTIAQLVAMIATMIGLVLDGKIPAVVKKSPQWQDWAANNIFFFGALALALISANALYTSRSKASSR